MEQNTKKELKNAGLNILRNTILSIADEAEKMIDRRIGDDTIGEDKQDPKKDE